MTQTPPRVLIVEDDFDLRTLERVALEIEGFEVHETDRGEYGVRMVEALRPDLVLMDVMMPGSTDGFEACAAIKADPNTRHIKVVMVTARTQFADSQRATAVGADAFVAKPFSPHMLVEMVKLLLVPESA